MQDIARMISGFKQFQNHYFRHGANIFDRLKDGQEPKILVVGCCDSRVDPALLTGAGPGDIFVIRNVANLVPPYGPDAGFHGVSSGIEYAVTVLKVTDVIVLGHSDCGGIAALLSDDKLLRTEFIQQWVEIARPAKAEIERELSNKPMELKRRACEEAALLISLENLLTFPWIRERVDAGTLALHGWYFDMRAGQLLAYSPEQSGFIPLT